MYIIGEDTMKDLPNWRSPEKVFTLCEFIVCCRSTNISPDSAVVDRLEEMGAKLHFLSLPPKDVSSTAIRSQLQQGLEPEDLSPQVTEYIHLMANSIALRQLMIDADSSIEKIFSADIATSTKLLNFSSVFKKSKLVILIPP
jgi:hypothetical protein